MAHQKGIIHKSKNGVLSVMYVPHRGGIRVIKVPYYQSLFAFVLCIVIFFSYMGVNFVTGLQVENAAWIDKYNADTLALQEQVNSLGALVQEQQSMLTTDAVTFSQHLNASSNSDQIFDTFQTNYEDMIVAYIDKNMKDLKVSRGGETNKSFKSDVENLRNVLTVAQNATQEELKATTSLDEKATQLSAYLDSLPTFWPVDASIGSDFGMRLHPVYHRWMPHTGVDMGAKKGTPISAAGDGVVVSAEYRSGYGRVVEVMHKNGFSTLYAHCSTMLVEAGATVSRGEVIAKVGQTGTATEPHLHFEVRINNTPVDPKRFITR